MRPMDFAGQLNVSLANGWGIVRTVADLCLKMPEGKYVLVKDPNKVRFHVPPLPSPTCFLARFAVLAHIEETRARHRA
jgi:translation initiation factor 3 subunit D